MAFDWNAFVLLSDLPFGRVRLVAVTQPIGVRGKSRSGAVLLTIKGYAP